MAGTTESRECEKGIRLRAQLLITCPWHFYWQLVPCSIHRRDEKCVRNFCRKGI